MSQRSILISVFIYELDFKPETDDSDVYEKLDNLSFYSPCELIHRHFSIGTDSHSTDEQCVEYFIGKLRDTGLQVGKYLVHPDQASALAATAGSSAVP